MKTWLLNTMSSPEFWKAVIAFLTAGGIVFDDAQANAIVAAGLSFMGLVNAYKHVTGN
jgi:hypothetical protein